MPHGFKQLWFCGLFSKVHRRVLLIIMCALFFTYLELRQSNPEGQKHSAKTDKTPRQLFEVPAVDPSHKSEQELVRELSLQMPNIPVIYLDENREKNWKLRKNQTCAKFPHLFELKISNRHWQELETQNGKGSFFFYRAYYDNRPLESHGPMIRILAMVDRIGTSLPNTSCQLWFQDSADPYIVKVDEYKYIWYKAWGNHRDGILQPYLISCRVPSQVKGEVPVMVSVVENGCDKANNALKVFHNNEVEELQGPLHGKNETRTNSGAIVGHDMKFAVCVKGMDFPTDDLSLRLAEWLEVLRSVGADKVFLYTLAVHPNVSKLLDYYVRDGLVDLTTLTLPGPQPNADILRHLYLKHKVTHKRQNEVIPYNDCLYRNMYRYQRVVLLDIDEVIMPLLHKSWSQLQSYLIANNPKGKSSSFCFRNVYFFDDMLESSNHGHFKHIPPYLHMLQHVFRSSEYSKKGFYVKCFHDTNKVKTLHNHYPFSCLGRCSALNVPNTLGHLQHYRSECVKELQKVCVEKYKNATVKDTSIWRYKDDIMNRTDRALKKLGFFQHK